MSQTVSVWLVLVAAFCAANLPFLNDRWLGVVPRARPSETGPKPIAWRLAELVACYFIIGGLALSLEHRAGEIAPQGWEFYAITGALFLTFAFPGFTWRYLLKHRR